MVSIGLEFFTVFGGQIPGHVLSMEMYMFPFPFLACCKFYRFKRGAIQFAIMSRVYRLSMSELLRYHQRSVCQALWNFVVSVCSM